MFSRAEIELRFPVGCGDPALDAGEPHRCRSSFSEFLNIKPRQMRFIPLRGIHHILQDFWTPAFAGETGGRDARPTKASDNPPVAQASLPARSKPGRAWEREDGFV